LQQANYDKQLKNIEMLRLGASQKEKLIDAATKDFEVYKVARAAFVEDKINQTMKSQGKGTDALEDILIKTKQAKEAAFQSGMDKLMQKRVTNVQSAVPQRPINHEVAEKQRADKTSLLFKYNTAQDAYSTMLNFKNSGNYNAIVIDLVAKGLDQGSFDPIKFDPTVRSMFTKVGDKWKLAIGKGDEQELVKAAAKYFEEEAKSTYKEFKAQLPMYQRLSLETSINQGDAGILDLYARRAHKNILDMSQDLSTKGLKKADEKKAQ
jgi:hypothetical protein